MYFTFMGHHNVDQHISVLNGHMAVILMGEGKKKVKLHIRVINPSTYNLTL